MATDEEYLDNLLKSLADSEEPAEESGDGPKDGDDAQETDGLAPSEPDEQVKAAEGGNQDLQPDIEEINDESFLDSLDLELDNIEDGKDDISEIPEQTEEPKDNAEPGNFTDAANLDDPELLQMFENLENTDPDLDEINSLLNKADMNEGVDDDMLALLQSADDSQNYDDFEEAFDIFAEGEMDELSGGGAKTGTAPENGSSDEKKKKKKEPGFFAKLLALLTKEDDEPDETNSAKESEKKEAISDENAKLLEELNGGGSKKAASKEKKKESKKDKKKKAKPGAKAKPKKPAKPKKVKEKKPEITEKPVKVLNKKGLVAIVALCATILASVLIMSSFLPQYASKQEARRAFNNGDYETTYELFYKKRLSKSETELYNKAKTVLRMERKLQSYNNNIAMDRELEAVDALFLGVKCYEGLREADTYGVRQEVDAVYQQICNILESSYGISQEEAISIIRLDNVKYTKRLKAIVGELPESEEADKIKQPEDSSQNEEADSQEAGGLDESSDMEDVLPEEEDIIE